MDFSAAMQWAERHEDLLAWLAAGSVATFLLSAVAIPMAVARMPADYFTRRPPRLKNHPLRLAGRVLKNMLGLSFALAGLTMLVLPGQGVLTLLIGISLMDFPRKRELEGRLVRLSAVQGAAQWLRRRAGRPPLKVPKPGADREAPSAEGRARAD